MFGLASFANNALAENDINLDLSPTNVKISAFYNGTTVQVTGKIPAAAKGIVFSSSSKNG